MSFLRSFTCPRTCALLEGCSFNPIFEQLGSADVFSHVIRVKIVIKDLDALIKAGAKHGLTFHTNVSRYKWYGRFVGDYPIPEGLKPEDLGKCTHVLRLDGNARAYEVGIVETKPGEYELLWDFWQGGYGLQEAIGEGGQKLIDSYTLEASKNAVETLGWYYEENSEGGLTVFHPSGHTMSVSSSGVVEAHGFEGQGCLEATSSLAELLGRPLEANAKPEMWSQDQTLYRS